MGLQTAQNFPAGYGPISVAVGDFDHDGHLDLAVANSGLYGDGVGVSVLLGNGDGSFQAARLFPAGGGPFSVAVGDFNGDSFPDLAVANYDSNDVVTLLNGLFTRFDAAAQEIGIAVSGVIAVWLTQDKRESWRRWACIFGMLGQPFRFYATWKAEQWGIFALCTLYTYAWARGVWTHWLSPYFSARRRPGVQRFPGSTSLPTNTFTTLLARSGKDSSGGGRA